MSSGQAQADQQQIQALLETRLAAIRAKDARQFVAAFDATIVKFDLAPPLHDTGPSVLDPAGLQWWLNTWEGEVIVAARTAEVVLPADRH